ncbi:MAG: hypothetical protein PUB18_05265 [bacterium]|nr:hypothetical protein [bacterium]
MGMSNEEILMYAEKLKDETHKYIIKNLYGNLKTKEQLAEDLGITKSFVTRKEHQAYRLIQQMKWDNDRAWELQYILSCYDEDGYLSFDKIAELNGINKEDLSQCFNEYIDSLTFDEKIIALKFGFSEEALKLANIFVMNCRIKGFSRHLNPRDAENICDRLKGKDVYEEFPYPVLKNDNIDEITRMDEQFLTRVTDIYDKYLEKQYNTEQQHKR